MTLGLVSCGVACNKPQSESNAPRSNVNTKALDPALILDPRVPDTTDATPRGAHAAHPKVAELLAELAESGADGGAVDLAHVSERTCVRWTGSQVDDIQSCSLRLLGNRTAAQVGLSYDCGDHSCSVETYTWYGAASEPYVDSSGASEVTPDHRYLLYDEFSYGDGSPEMVRGLTLRLDRNTRRMEPFLDCFSARLSPLGRYYVCRDLKGNVLRVPVAGGPQEIVVRTKLPPEERLKLGGPFFDYPGPVEFLSRHELEYDLYLLDSGTYTRHRAAWHE